MHVEVALIETDPRRGVRILGRSADPKLVQSVRAHLVDRLQEDPEPTMAVFRPVWPHPSSEGDAEQ